MTDPRAPQSWIHAAFFWDGLALHRDVAIALRGRKIGEIVPIALASARWSDRGKTAVDLLLPGLANAHSHAFQRAFRGWVQAGDAGNDFFLWRRAMYSVAAALGPDEVGAIARLAFVEMAEAGVTTVGEFHYLHHDRDGSPYPDPDELARRVIDAALDVGLRVTLLRTAYHCGDVGKAALPQQRRFLDQSPDDVLAAAQRLGAIADDRVKVGIAPHSVRAVPRSWLGELAAFEGVVHAHVAEQPAEVRACVAAHGVGPLQLLASAGLVDERFVAVHLTHPSEGDEELVARTGMRICACPSTELDLGDGFLPMSMRDSERLCVGSDSHAQIDLFAEARALELHGRGQAGRRLVLAQSQQVDALAAEVLRCATLRGRSALGWNGAALAEGSGADLVGLDLQRPAAEGVPPLCAAAFNATPEWVSDVWTAGRRIVADGRHALRGKARRDAAAVIRERLSSSA